MILEFEWFSRFRNKSKKHSKHDGRSDNVFEAEAETSTDMVNGFLANATNFTIYGAHMFDRPQIFQTIHTGTTALDRLLPYTCPDAAMDSSARHPPPRCHPRTRQRIMDILNHWLINHLLKVFWLSGPAGTGKSAVAQSFAEMCLEQGRLGAAYFFFQSSGRNNPRTVIPSLAYQLAVNVPHYGNLLGHAIARDPSIFQKTPRAQLWRLVVEPFTLLQAQDHGITQTPFLIILDGLDECQGIEAQCEFVDMVGEVVRLKKDLPLLWLIASRPEPHLQYIFCRADFCIDCSKEVLLINADTRDDVSRYLRDSFIDMRTRFPLVTNAAWPSELQLQRLEDIVSGLFALAATTVRYVSDMKYGDPVGRLVDFLAFMSNTDHIATTNPLQTLDLLYSQILSKVPENVYPITKRILAIYCYSYAVSTVVCCKIFHMDKNEFYNALNELHALFYVPPSPAVDGVYAYHKSLRDYLTSRFRSGRFYIDGGYIHYLGFKQSLLLYQIMVQDPHWVSDDPFTVNLDSATSFGVERFFDGGMWLYLALITFAPSLLWCYFAILPRNSTVEFLGQFEQFDFRYMLVSRMDGIFFASFVEWLFSLGPHNRLSHTEPQDGLEEALLAKAINEVDRRMEPAVFPMDLLSDSEYPYRYAFVGSGIRSCLFWFDKERRLSGRCRLSCKVPLKEMYTVSDCVIHLPEDDILYKKVIGREIQGRV